MFTQGGKGIADYDMKHIRIMGILQRVAVAIILLLCVNCTGTTGAAQLEGRSTACPILVCSRALWPTGSFCILCIVWCGIMFGVDVPATYAGVDECGYGKLTVACNAQWVVDEAILGKDHMYYPSNGGDREGRGMTFQRLPECSTCSPGLCSPNERQRNWAATSMVRNRGI